MEALFNLAWMVTQVAYFAYFGAAFWAEHRVKTLAALRKACQRYWTAAALAALVMVINIATAVVGDGWWKWFNVAMNVLTLATCIACAIFASRKRDRRVIEEMQRDLGRDL